MELIFDIGMHRGEDTDFYLKKGFRVVGVEANPELCEHCRERFSDYRESGDLTIVNKVISTTDDGAIDFYVFDQASIWGTASLDRVKQNEKHGTKGRRIRVPATTLPALVSTYGLPYYVKIDIEGFDNLCLEQLVAASLRPEYLSVESSVTSMRQTIYQLQLLERMGYKWFKIVPQHLVSRQTCPSPAREGLFIDHAFEHHSSGLFGKELPGEWQTINDVKAEYRKIHFAYRVVGPHRGLFRAFPVPAVKRTLNHIFWRGKGWSWYDTHATT